MNLIQFQAFEEAKTYFDLQRNEQYKNLTIKNLGEGLEASLKLGKTGKCTPEQFLSLSPEFLVKILSQSAKAHQKYQALQCLIKPLRKEIKQLTLEFKIQTAKKTLEKSFTAENRALLEENKRLARQVETLKAEKIKELGGFIAENSRLAQKVNSLQFELMMAK